METERKHCGNCYHGRSTYCALNSATCATAVFNKEEEIPRWMSVEDGIIADAEIQGRKKEVR